MLEGHSSTLVTCNIRFCKKKRNLRKSWHFFFWHGQNVTVVGHGQPRLLRLRGPIAYRMKLGFGVFLAGLIELSRGGLTPPVEYCNVAM